MQIVIDIPERIVINIKDYCGMSIAEAKEILPIILNAIHNGTLIPEGHGRLIDADALENAWHEEFLKGMSISSGMLNTFRDALTIIEAESEEYK